MHKHGGARTRGLAAELKELRARSGMTTREVAKRTGFSIATVNRMENGRRRITPEDAASLLAVYGVTGAARARILVLARDSDLSGWWETDDGDLPVHLPALGCFEADASRIVHVAMLRIPGLLQTADYIRTALIAVDFPAEKRKSMAAARLQRQKVLLSRTAPNYLAIIDEAALRRPTGSRELMAAQCHHLVAMAERPRIDIRIIPFDRGSHAGLDGSYVQMEFAKASPIIYLELVQSSMFRDAEREVRPYLDTTDKLMKVALSSAESVKFLRRLAGEYGRE
ncbi:Helix-turn-helix domain-containing protein [Actinokineospora alba]|uniref:Helix-turn-helix domain-containing protein n=1 Tax=Actinokineospora alba TaxID=504798 RepID=A0A1H0WI11_9PSEU|nr:helix-turn-helix transcriptional regulator [Actinokineospora alba]TDP65359.1 helix-turn-helix protein [Actinokineospora alba]SDH60400.1 Helix-turn-helix domain-containing protein [Actinokineospora alba]SDP90125.1 Helix-turn-helix domain-containing protein [Actinokineospora alba]